MDGMMQSPPSSNVTEMHMHHMMVMHMTFFWGKNFEVLFSGWPGTKTSMYILSLVVIFVLSVLVEWFSYCRLTKPAMNNIGAGLIQTAMHATRIGLAYIVMLAVMSFNGGIFLVAVAGHSLGFLLFGSRVFRSSAEVPPHEKISDLPPITC